MKKIYCIRSAKAEDFSTGLCDYERSLNKKGRKQCETIGSYLLLRNIEPDIVLSSCALRAQESALKLLENYSFAGEQYFLEELYFKPYEALLDIIMVQDNALSNMFVIGHTPQLNELVNHLSVEAIGHLDHMSVVALEFDIESWSEIQTTKAKVAFHIYPKQFKYYMPRQMQRDLT